MYSIIVLFCSLSIFIASTFDRRFVVLCLGLALLTNVLPFVATSTFESSDTRFFGIPLAYIPFMAFGLGLAVRARLSFNKQDTLLLCSSVLLLAYLSTSMMREGATLSTFIYFVAWPLNFLFLFSAIKVFSELSLKELLDSSRFTLLALLVGAVVGIFKYLVGLQSDSNFMPLMNRNGMVILVIMLIPLTAVLYEFKKISRALLVFSIVVCFLCILLTFSRSGILGLIIVLLLTFLKLKGKNVIYTGLAAACLSVILLSSSGEKVRDKLNSTTNTIMHIYAGDNFDSSMADYKRVLYISTAFKIIDDNFWFGAGVGMENYTREFIKHVNFREQASKPHNFYISAFAELGVIGFTILMINLVLLYKSLINSLRIRAFLAVFWSLAIMMLMNEYILLSMIWIYFGFMIGFSRSIIKNRLN